jgi:cAMP-dependent protein kinase regulator
LEQKLTIEKELSAEPKMIGFGEIALLLNDKRTASVIATGESGSNCWVLSADVFKHIIAQNTLRRRGLNLGYLNHVQLFKNLETYDKMKLIDGLKQQLIPKGDFVFKEGDIGNEFFIIEQGECECLKTSTETESGY